LMTAIVAIFVAATEALAEVIVVIIPLYVIAIITVVGILIGVRVLVVGLPAILPVCLSSTKAFLIAVVHGPPERLCAVLIRLVVAATARVPITWGRVEVWIVTVVIVTFIPEAYLLLTQAL